jgi:hypothetical protein
MVQIKHKMNDAVSMSFYERYVDTAAAWHL